MIVYHGGIDVIKKPDINHSYRPLDFGKGFYITTVKEQAEKWARRKADIAFISQKAIDNLLSYSSSYEVK